RGRRACHARKANRPGLLMRLLLQIAIFLVLGCGAADAATVATQLAYIDNPVMALRGPATVPILHVRALDASNVPVSNIRVHFDYTFGCGYVQSYDDV